MGKIPPLQQCRECGEPFRTWRDDPLCGTCLGAIGKGVDLESLRAFRARLPTIQQTYDSSKKGR